MEKETLLNSLTTLEANLNDMNKQFKLLKEMTIGLIEENVQLQLERDNLSQLIQKENEKVEKKVTKKKVLQSKENLAILYSEGFHICPGELFGKIRETGSDCIFCLDILDDNN